MTTRWPSTLVPGAADIAQLHQAALRSLGDVDVDQAAGVVEMHHMALDEMHAHFDADKHGLPLDLARSARLLDTAVFYIFEAIGAYPDPAMAAITLQATVMHSLPPEVRALVDRRRPQQPAPVVAAPVPAPAAVERERWTAEEIAAYWRHRERLARTAPKREEFGRLASMYEDGSYVEFDHDVGTVKKANSKYHRHNWPQPTRKDAS